MDFLVASSNGEPVMILIIIAIVVIAAGIVVYYFLSSTNTKNKKPTINKPVNFEVANNLSDSDTKEVSNKFQEEFMEDVLEESLPEIENEEEKTSNNIASLLEQMQQDLDDSEGEIAKVEKYEEEQEENAIISYKELMRLKAERENNAEVVKHNDDLIPTHVEAIKQVEEVKEESKNDEIKKFKKSEFISPVFGLNDSNVTYREIRRPERKERNDEYSSREDEVEVVNLEKDDNIKSVEDERNDDFLEALVDFRNKLN